VVIPILAEIQWMFEAVRAGVSIHPHLPPLKLNEHVLVHQRKQIGGCRSSSEPTSCECINVERCGSSLSKDILKLNEHFWSEYYKCELSKQANLKHLTSLVAKKSHTLKEGPLHAYYSGELVKGSMCKGCKDAGKHPLDITRNKKSTERYYIELSKALEATDLHPAQMLHQDKKYAHWIAVRVGHEQGTGLMLQIKDIVEGEENFFVYAEPDELRTFDVQFQLCDKAAADKIRKEDKGRNTGHGGDRRSVTRSRKLKMSSSVGPRLGQQPTPPLLLPPESDGMSVSTESMQLFECGPESTWNCMQKSGYTYYHATQYLISEWEKLEAVYGKQNFDEVIQSVDPMTWDQIEDDLGIGRRWARQQAQLGPIKAFVDLVVKGVDQIKMQLSDRRVTLERLDGGTALLSGCDANDQTAHFDSNHTRISWLFNSADNYDFDLWPQSHLVYKIAEDSLNRGTSWGGGHFPDALINHPCQRKTITMEGKSLILFGGHLLHRGTRNKLGKPHVRFFGELQVIDNDHATLTTAPQENTTHFPLPIFYPLFDGLT